MVPSAASDAPSPRPARRRRIWLPRALLEASLIVLSVLLALVLNAWREDRQQAERVEVALQSVRAELRENLQSMERARANHRAMQDALKTYAARGESPPKSIYLGGIFSPALVHSAAWESARETGATATFPYELMLALSRLYGEQARYQALGATLVEDLMVQIRRDGVEVVLRDSSASFIPLQEDFANREQRLAEAYERALDELETQAAAAR
jgi:hypothetical protein